MKRLLISIIVAASAATVSAAHSPLLPKPQQVHYGSGALPLRGLSVRFASPPAAEDRFAAEQLASRLSAISQAQIPIRKGKGFGGSILLNRAGTGTALPGDNERAGPDSREAYSLQVTPKGLVITSARERMFCSGANIYMLGTSTHAWKVNFCKFTNETRSGIEDSSRHEGLKALAAVNGTVAGGGYELALACDEILMIDDRSSTVSLPELPLLGVLPGTGGLTRVTDKRRVRRDLADVFCTTSEGVRADRAKQWRLIDHIAKPQGFRDAVAAHAAALASQSTRGSGSGVKLNPLKRTIDASGYHYDNVDVKVDRKQRTATITVFAPRTDVASGIEAIHAAGDKWWPLAMARELDDAILMLRTNDLEIGTWIFNTRGDANKALAADAALKGSESDWFGRQVIGFLRRTLARLDVSSRTLFAVIDKGSCFAGTLLELALAADRSYMLELPDDESGAPARCLQVQF